MRLAYTLLYLAQWVVYLIRLLFAWAYSLLQFVSKPGSRLIVPVVAAPILFVMREELYPQVDAFLRAIDFQTTPDALLFDALLAIGFTLAACGYVILSRLLAIVLGTFPPITRPLPPVRRLSVGQRAIRPVVVRQVVPRLRRRWL